MTTIDTAAQLAALEGEVGFREGPNNENPWGVWQSEDEGGWLTNAAYCDSFAQWGAVAHGGYRWPDHCQFGWRGDAYCPYTEQHARELGLWRDAADYFPLPGDQILFDWTGWGGCDHIGTVVGSDDDYFTIWCVEGNTGSPNGVHYVRRDWTYIRGFVALSAVAQEDDMFTDDDRKLLENVATYDARRKGQPEQIDGLDLVEQETGQNVKTILSRLNDLDRRIDDLQAGGGTVDIEALADRVADKLAERLKA